MANVAVFNMEGKEVGTLDLSDAVFGVEVNEHLVHMAVVWQLANKRQGTQKAKTRSEVSGGGRNLGDRKEPVMQDRVQPDLLSGPAAVWYSLPFREIIPSSLTRRKRELLLNLH